LLFWQKDNQRFIIAKKIPFNKLVDFNSKFDQTNKTLLEVKVAWEEYNEKKFYTATELLALPKAIQSEVIGLKFTVTRKDGAVSTQKHALNKPIEMIVQELKIKKDWIEGKLEEIRIDFYDLEGNYFKEYIDVSKYQSLLKTPF
jgi:hypothetical protein